MAEICITVFQLMVGFDAFIMVKHKQTCLQYRSCNRICNLKEQMFQKCQHVMIKALLTGLFKFCVVKCGSLTHSKILLVIK